LMIASVLATAGPTLKWTWSGSTGDLLSNSVTVDSKGNLYVQDQYAIYAISPTGSLIWKTDAPLAANSADLVIGFGGLFHVGYNISKFAMATGKLLWLNTEVSTIDTPVLFENYLYGVNRDSAWCFDVVKEKVVWKTNINFTGLLGFSPAALDTVRKQLYVGSDNSTMVALNSETGEVLWTFWGGKSSQEFWDNAPGVDLKTGTVFPAGSFHYLLAVTPDGKLKYQSSNRTGEISCQPVFLPKTNQMLYTTDGWTLYSRNPDDGTIQWQYEATDMIYSRPAVSKNNHVYVGDYAGTFQSVDLATGAGIWKDSICGRLNHSPTINGCAVYVLCDQKVFAYDDC